MSAYSTLHITRSKAKAFIFDKVNNMSDTELEEILDRILEHRLYNTLIVSDDAQDPDDCVL